MVEEETGLQDGPVGLVVYDREKTRVLAVEKGEYSSEGPRRNPIAIIDGQVDRSAWAGTGVAGFEMRQGSASAGS